MNYARAIRVARAIKGYSQKDLAAAAGRDQSYISKLEAGKRVPSQQMLNAIADGLDIPRIVLNLLAAETEDLRGIPTEKHAQEFGSTLIKILLEVDKEKRE